MSCGHPPVTLAKGRFGQGWWQNGSHTAWSGSAQTLRSREAPHHCLLPWTIPPDCTWSLLGHKARSCRVCLCAQSLICVPFLETPWTVVCQASLSIGIFQARILEWVAISSSRALPNQGIERTSPATLALQADSLPLSHRGSLQLSPRCNLKSQELTFGKVASDSKNVLAQGEIYSSDERGGDQGREGSKIPSVPPGASAAIVLFYEASLSSSEKKWHDCSMHISSWRGSFPCCAFSPLAQVFLKPKLHLSDPKSDSFSSPHWDCGTDFSLGSEQQMAD